MRHLRPSYTGGGWGGWTVGFAPYAYGFGGGGGGGGGGGCQPSSAAPGLRAQSVLTLPAPASMPRAAAAEGVCARVRIRIEQEAVMTRAAFVGTLEIDNDGITPITGIQVTLDFRDAGTNSASDKFVTRGPKLVGLTDVDGNGQIPAGASGSAQYTFIPNRDAAPTAPAIYKIGGVLRYLDNGTEVVVPLLSSTITVFPEARLALKYFQQRDVYSDDPFTDEIEPAEPFALGLIVKNNGAGAAKNFRITSAQPKIVENDKGLLIDFKIIGTKVGTNALSPTLTANMGNIEPGGSQVAEWLLTSSLQGKFIDYSATFEHVDSLGAANLSLIDSVEIHELIHVFQGDRVGDDNMPDFMVNDEPDPDNAPDTLYFSDGTTAILNNALTPAADRNVSLGNFVVHVTANVMAGWSYFNMPDPGARFKLYRVARSDGKELRVGDNVWQTDRSFPSSQAGVRREWLVHLLDHDSTGSYTFYYRVDDAVAPSITQVSEILPNLQTGPVGSVDVVFSEQIDLPSFDYTDVVLTLNGGSNLINTAVTVSQLTTNSYRISGLASLTTIDGNYELTVVGSGIQDFGGNAVMNSASTAWAKGAVSPVVVTCWPGVTEGTQFRSVSH